MLPLGGALIDHHMVELEHHVELPARRVGEHARLLERDGRHLADGQQLRVAPGEHLAVHLLQELVDPRAAACVRAAIAVERARVHLAVRQCGILGDQIDHVHAEPVDSAVQPPVHHRVDRRPDVRVLPVEVGLLAREQVQVVLVGGGVELPGRPGEPRAPVVGLGAPPVPVALRVGATRARGGEPGVLVGGVVDHEVEDQLDPARVGAGQQRVEVGEGAERRIDVAVVGDVVAGVVLRRRIDGGEPDHVNAEGGDVVEPRRDAGQVADAVPVGVGEAARDRSDRRPRTSTTAHRTLPATVGPAQWPTNAGVASTRSPGTIVIAA